MVSIIMLQLNSGGEVETMKVYIDSGLFVQPIGEAEYLNSLFSSICHHLEKSVWGSVYPIVMIDLYSGQLSNDKLSVAIREIQSIRNGLKKVSPHDVVWDFNDLTIEPPWGREIRNKSVRSLYDYYITDDGKNLIDCIEQAFSDAIEDGSEVKIEQLK